MKILVFIDFDAVIRHFVLSGAFREIERRHEVKYVFHTDATSEKRGMFTDPVTLGLKNWTTCEIPRARMGSWDRLYSVVALHNHLGADTFSLRKALVADVRGWNRAHLYHALALPGVYGLARRYFMRKIGVYKPLADLIAAEMPDLIIHPSLLSGYFINELLQISKTTRIPLLVVMNSWDNPSAKAMNTGWPTKLVVWGPQTKQHAVTNRPEPRKYMCQPTYCAITPPTPSAAAPAAVATTTNDV